LCIVHAAPELEKNYFKLILINSTKCLLKHQNDVLYIVMAIFNPFVPSFKINPYLQYSRLRSDEPVHRSMALQAWILTRYEDCLNVLKDIENFSSDGRYASGEIGRAVREQRKTAPLGDVDSLLTVDPPTHTHLRGIINREFTPRRVERLLPRIEEIACELCNDIDVLDEFDLIDSLALPLPVIVIAELLGIPPSDRQLFKEWSNKLAATTDVFNSEQAIKEAQETTQELILYFSDFMNARRRFPEDDLISAFVHAQSDGVELSDDEILAFSILLLVAGNETTTNLIGNGIMALVNNQKSFSLIKENPNQISAMVEEILRFDSPVQGVVRIAKNDLSFDGTDISAGEVVMAMVGAANHDPEQFVDPETFDINRLNNRHLSFGLGPHFCLGAPLARLEASVLFKEFFKRFSVIESARSDVERGGTLLLRGFTKLPILVKK